jgi:N-acetylmuramoyl-L-alanine amidase
LLLAAQLAARTGDGAAASSAARRLAARYGGTPEATAAEPLARSETRKGAEAASDDGEDGGEEEESEEKPATPPTKSAQARAGKGAATGDVDVPAEAAKLLGHVIEAARSQAEARSRSAAGDTPPEPEAPEPLQGLTVKAAVPPRAERAEEDDEDAVSRAKELRSSALRSGSVASQLGLKIRRVVVDPGHGGRDTGAIGPHGAREKDVALAIAKKLAARLRKLGLSVVLTRKDDTYVSLDERTRIANEARADLFVSVHCNAARKSKLSGVETWTLNVTSDRYATRLASFENAGAERTVSDLRMILADLATRANASDARDLAQSVQSALARSRRARPGRDDHGLKQALFYVLLGTHMPAVLVETGFISNPAEEARLRTHRYQEATAEAIASGVKEFVDGRQRLARAP